MGLSEQIRAGASLTRDFITFAGSGLGSVNLGSAYALLSITVDKACRIRLYDYQASRDNITERARTFGSPVPNDISLIGDFNIGAAGTYMVDPILFACTDPSNHTTWYNIDVAGGNANITINRYLLYNQNTTPTVGGVYAVDNRRTVAISSGGSIANNAIVSGVITSAPNTYLITEINSSTSSRLRLYRKSGSLSDTTELNRIFSVEPSPEVALIGDIQITGGQTIYVNPKIVAANTDTMGNSLVTLKSAPSAIPGKTEIYYFLQNTSGGSTSITVNMKVLALEN